MSTYGAVLRELPKTIEGDPGTRRRPDLWMLGGIAVVLAATIAGIAATGVGIGYFFQPTGVLIVLGGTLGVMFITTPRAALQHSVQRVMDLFWTSSINREKLIEELVSYSRIVRSKGLLALDPMVARASNQFLEESLLLALDVRHRNELQATLETKLRLKERQGEADAKTLEVAGGFAPTIGVLGTVVGLIDVLRQFSTPSAVAYGIGTAFVSTIYGLALANLVLLPAAHRIRAKVAEVFEVQELMMEGMLCLFDRMHPSLVRERLNCFLREARGGRKQSANLGMSPKYFQREIAGRDRWMISYLDVLTILLIFFVALAAQTFERPKAAVVAPPAPAPVAIPVAKSDPIPEPQQTLLRAQQQLADHGLDMRMEPRGLVISLPQAILFSSGEDRVANDALPIVSRIADVLRDIPNEVSLIGHADAVPIHNRYFRSNWDLSAARGLRLLELLSRKYGIAEARLSVASYGPFRPHGPNGTPEGRAHNRRVEIVILGEPAAQ